MLKIIVTIGTIQALAIIVNLIKSKLVAVLLGPEGVGIISIVDQVVQFVAYLSVFSLPFASVKFLSMSHSEGFEAFRRSYSSFLKTLLLLSSVGATITICLVVFRAGLLGSEISRYRAFLILALFGIPSMALGGFFNNVLAAAQKTRASAMTTVINSTALVITAYIGISMGGIFGLYVGTVLAGFLVAIGILIYLHRTLNLPLYDRTVRIFEELKRSPDVIPFSFMLYLASITHSVSFLIARYSVLMNFGETETGLLQAVIAITMAMGMVLGPANGLFLTPIMNRNISKGEKIHTANEFQKKLIIIMSFIAMAIVLFPQLILILLFSPLFAVASQYVFIFIISQCILQLAAIYQALIIGFDDLKTYAAITCIGNLSFGVFSWFLAPQYGILGISIGFFISSLVIFMLTFASLRLKHGFSIPGNLGFLVRYSLLAILLVGMIFSKYEDWNIKMVFLKIGIYICFILTLLLFLSKEERNSIYGLWSKIRLRLWKM